MPHAHAQDRAFFGSVLHTPIRGEVALLRDALVLVDRNGRIAAVHRRDSARSAGDDMAECMARYAAAGNLVTLEDGQYLLPGTVDLHVHAPQWPQRGLALDLPLEEWLQAYTFPLESRYADLDFAAAAYESLVHGLLANGTTTALYFGTIHVPATQKLADICLRRSQRALIGRVAMDNPLECPEYYRDASPAAAEADTRAFIDYVHGMPGNEAGLIMPVITPRFIPSCSDDLLTRLGALARQTGAHVQTHCSESDWAHAYVLDRYGITDTEALESFGLLTRRTVLAHGNFIGDADVTRIVRAGAGIAHCPLSNVYFSDAVFPLRRMLTRGVHVGLGTDIAGGGQSLPPGECPACGDRLAPSRIRGGSRRAARAPAAARLAHRCPDRLLGGDGGRRHRARPAHRQVRRGLSIRCHGDRCQCRGRQSQRDRRRPGGGHRTENHLPRRAQQHSRRVGGESPGARSLSDLGAGLT